MAYKQPAAENLGWGTGGNSSLSATNFLGHISNVDLVFKTNNTEKARLTKDGKLGIGTTIPDEKLHLSDTTSGVYGVLDGFGDGVNYGGLVVKSNDSNKRAQMVLSQQAGTVGSLVYNIFDETRTLPGNISAPIYRRTMWLNREGYINTQVGQKFYRETDQGDITNNSVYTLYQEPDYDFMIMQRTGSSFNNADSVQNPAVYSIFQVDAPVNASNVVGNTGWIGEATFALSVRPGAASRTFVDYFCQEYQEPVGVGVRVQKRGPNAVLQNFDFSFSDGTAPGPGLAPNYSVFSVNTDRTISLFTNNATSNSVNRSAIKLGAPSGMTVDRTLLFPATAPTASQVLSVTSVAGGVANLGWTTVSGVGGLTSLNGLTGTTQTFSGTDIIITSTGINHAITINDAGVSSRGVVTTGTQTLSGNKTLTGNTTQVGTLTTSASQNHQFRFVVNTNSTLTDTDEYIAAKTNTANVTLTLPDPSTRVGRVYKIRWLSNVNTCTIDAATNGSTIDGLGTYVFPPGAHKFIEIITDGGDWYFMCPLF